MKNTWKKRLLALLVTSAMALGFAACNGGNGDGEQNVNVEAGGNLFTEPTTIKWVISSNVSWPYNEDWIIWKTFQEKTGASFDIDVIPYEDYETKLNLMLAEGGSDLPDIFAGINKVFADQLGEMGAILAIDDYVDNMPNYTEFWNSIPEDERTEKLLWRKASDGKTYYPQVYGTDEMQSLRAWMYRKDIFEKNNLSVPATMDELYEVCKKLKELYPESYPLCVRNGLVFIDNVAPEWKEYLLTEYHYDFVNEKWTHGVLDPEMLEIVKYLRKMYQEGLINPDYLTTPAKGWEELMSTDRGFITCDYVVRVNFFNEACRKENPEYTLAGMVPPKADSANATNMMQKQNVDLSGLMIVNTGDKKRIANTIKLVDWMYTDEAAQMCWGVQDVSYKVNEDGSKEYIRPAEGDIQNAYGVFTTGTYLRADPKAAEDFATGEHKEAVKLALEYTSKKYNPVCWLALTDDENDKMNILKDSISTYVTEMMHKYLMCEEPIETWDSFIKEVEKLGINDVIAIYEQAYNRVK